MPAAVAGGAAVKALFVAALAGSLLFSPLHARTDAIYVTDDRGASIPVSAPARRVVSLAPHLTELIYAAGGEAALLAADSYSDYPPAASRLPRIGDAAGIDLERVLSLHPDLVFGWLSGNKPSDVARLEQLGLRVYLSEPRRLRDIPRTLRDIGVLLGTSVVAEQAARAFERQLRDIGANAGEPDVPVFVEIWQQPLMTINGQHLVSDVLRLCGGRNVFDSAPSLAPAVSLESVLAADPAVIIAIGLPDEAIAAWSQWPRLQAVKQQQIQRLQSDLITRGTPRILEGVERVCAWLAQARER